MSFPRFVFAVALLMLIAGILGSRYIFDNLLHNTSGAPLALVAKTQLPVTDTPMPATAPPATTRPTVGATRVPSTHAITVSTSVAKPNHHPSVRTSTAAPVHSGGVASRVVHRTTDRSRARPPTGPTSAPASAAPTSLPTSIRVVSPVVSLVNYWVGSASARRGQTVTIGYVIRNETGRTARVMLGASIKSSRVRGWLERSLSDPRHDVVAIVPAGVTTHIRYFSLPTTVRPGSYDVAWGLRQEPAGARAALAAAAGALEIVR